VDLQTVQIQYRAKHNDLPQNVLKSFTLREGGYVLRGKFNFILPLVHSRKKSCVSIKGVKLWNNLNQKLKERPNIKQFRKIFK